MILVFGSINMDIIFTPERAPEAGETVLLNSCALLPGGKGANQAVAAARMGADVKMAGCVGTDGFGKQLSDYISGQNVDMSALGIGKTPTGIATITVDSTGENRIMVASGANLEAHSAQVSDALLDQTSILLMQMELDAEQTKQVAQRAAKLGKQVILNLAPAAPIGTDLLEALDILILNEIEICQLAEHLGITIGDDYMGAAKQVSEKYNLTCVITLGAQGAVAHTASGEVLSARALPLKPEQIIDTTGAGDAFCGTLAASLDKGEGLQDAMELASIAGSLACLKQGAMSSYPTLEEAQKARAEAQRKSA